MIKKKKIDDDGTPTLFPYPTLKTAKLYGRYLDAVAESPISVKRGLPLWPWHETFSVSTMVIYQHAGVLGVMDRYGKVRLAAYRVAVRNI